MRASWQVTRTSGRQLRSAAALGQSRADVGDRLVGVLVPDRGEAELAGGFAVQLHVVDEEARLRRQSETLEGDLVDLPFGLAVADIAGVDHHLEDLVDRQHRAPERLP